MSKPKSRNLHPKVPPLKPPKIVRNPWFLALLTLLVIACAGSIVVAKTLFADLPSPKKLESSEFPVSTQIFDRHGTLLYEIYADTNRTPVPLKSLPDSIKQATIAIEDQNFYRHFGFSFQGIARAIRNIVFKDKLQGGSTITQQLVKTALLSPERTLQRKIREAVLTIATEVLYSKNQILEMYLNHIPYGGTAYGIEAAAQRYFGKSSHDLTLAEAALLAGLPQAPSRYSPHINPEQAKARQHQVLRRMVEDGYITQTTADQAFAETLTYALPATDIKAPHFVFYIKDILEQQYGLERVEQGGLRVTTSLDLPLQETAQASVSSELTELANYRVNNGAALITKPNTGEILAMVGSKDYFDVKNDGQVNLTNRLRQPGSSIKPLNYVTALQTGRLQPGSILVDYPTCFKVPGTQMYCPKNYDGGFHGPVTFRQALGNSYNIPAVKVLAVNSLGSMIATASAMGISSFINPERYGLSLTLGGGEVTMLDMATAFSTLANQGVKIEPHPILKITDYTGVSLYEYQPEATPSALMFYFDDNNPNSNTLGVKNADYTRVLNRQPAYLISDILADNTARSSAFGSNSQLRIKNQTVSVKTGTTNDLRDNWTIGYTPDYLVAVWVGNNDNQPMNPRLVSGVTGAAPIWHNLMSYILNGVPDHPQPKPQEIDTTSTCSGNRTPDADPATEICSSRVDLYWTKFPPPKNAITRKNMWVYKDSQLPAFINTGDPNAPPVDVNNLELKEHTLVSDPFVEDFCLDCTWQIDDKGKSQIPVINFDTTKDKPVEGSQTDTPH